MNTNPNNPALNINMKKIGKLKLIFIFISVSLCISGSLLLSSQSFTAAGQTNSPYNVGERITYDISFEKFENAAYAEIYVVSKGKLDGKDSVELSGKLKSSGLVSAAFYLFDETRSTFVAGDTGLPLYVSNVSGATGLPKRTINNFLKAPTTHYDILSMIYKVRNAGGAGSFSVQENEKIYNFDFSATGGELVTTAEGSYETTLSTVQSGYLTERQITNFRVNFTNDERRIPVQIRFKTPKGSFKAIVASVQSLEPTPTPEITQTATPIVVIKKTPTPTPTPQPYIDNQNLSEDIPFDLGESLEFKVTKGTQDIGNVVLQAKERKEFNGEDSLLLQAKVTEVGQGTDLLSLNNAVEAQVEPYTLTPSLNTIKLNGGLSIFNQIANFNQDLGEVTINGGQRQNVPVGTHSILSIAYAIRSFNLKPSPDPKNPVNDTRVAVLLGNKPYVLTLRPQNAKILNLKGEKTSAQLISIRTGNRSIDRLNIRLWLSTDSKRLPLRFAIGSYQADLVQAKMILPK